MKILHLEDNPRDAALVRDMLAEEWPDCFISVVATRGDFESLLKLGGYDLIISDYQLPGFNGLDALDIVREMAPETPFVFFSGTLGEESAIDAVRSGAADYVIKDRIQRLPMSVRRVLREAQERRERQRIEAALAQEQSLLHLLMENLPDHVYFKDLQSAFISVSRSKARSHGLEPEQMKGRSDFEIFGPKHARRAFDDEQRIIRTGEPMIDVEEKITWPDGTESWMSATKLPLKDAAGHIIGTFGISRDITARKRDEERMREQAEIINEAPIAICISDLANRITYCNEGAAKIYGLKREEMIGRTGEELLDPESGARLRAAREQLKERSHWAGVIPLTMRTGRTIQAELHLSQIVDSTGQLRARLTIGIDVTEAKKMEEQFLRVQRLEGLGMLAAGIAHDLNNVLAPILMAAPLLRADVVDPHMRRMLDTIESSAARGAGLVRQILSFAQGASGGMMILQPKHLLHDMAGLIHQTFPKKIQLEHEIAANLWAIHGNSTQLHQVLLNLCVNARDAMPEGGKLRLRAGNRVLDAAQAQAWPGARPGPYVQIDVGDSGTGIPPEVLARIWEPFFTTKGEGKGTGLGLSTVRGIVASHEGFIVLDTQAGRGTMFHVFLPAAEPSAAGQPRSGSTQPFPARGKGELLLVVDDEKSIREVLVAILSHYGYRVLAAGSGQEALDLYRARAAEIALVVTDLGMPGMDGTKLAAALQLQNPAVKLLFISGAAPGGGVELAPEGKLTLNKPFTREDLLKAIQRALDQAPA